MSLTLTRSPGEAAPRPQETEHRFFVLPRVSPPGKLLLPQPRRCSQVCSGARGGAQAARLPQGSPPMWSLQGTPSSSSHTGTGFTAGKAMDGWLLRGQRCCTSISCCYSFSCRCRICPQSPVFFPVLSWVRAPLSKAWHGTPWVQWARGAELSPTPAAATETLPWILPHLPGSSSLLPGDCRELRAGE